MRRKERPGLPVPIARVRTPEHRVTVRNVVEWQQMRGQHDQYANDPFHNLLHINKALGPVAATLEHRQHGESEGKVEQKRFADLIIHSIWLVSSMGYDPAALVANRVWDLGIGPKRSELPPEERGEPAGRKAPKKRSRK